MRKVMVIDDEPSILHSTSALLQQAGYEVATCSEASRILESIGRERPEIVLHDVRMPGLDLDRVVLAIRARWPDLPIVLFTAGMDGDEISDRVKANGIIEKPFRPHELLQTLDRAVTTTA